MECEGLQILELSNTYWYTPLHDMVLLEMYSPHRLDGEDFLRHHGEAIIRQIQVLQVYEAAIARRDGAREIVFEHHKDLQPLKKNLCGSKGWNLHFLGPNPVAWAPWKTTGEIILVQVNFDDVTIASLDPKPLFSRRHIHRHSLRAVQTLWGSRRE